MEKLDGYEVYISIIISAYNSENKLENTVNSILKQPFKDIEIIIVDAGSTDETGNIADSLRAKNRETYSYTPK